MFFFIRVRSRIYHNIYKYHNMYPDRVTPLEILWNAKTLSDVQTKLCARKLSLPTIFSKRFILPFNWKYSNPLKQICILYVIPFIPLLERGREKELKQKQFCKKTPNQNQGFCFILSVFSERFLILTLTHFLRIIWAPRIISLKTPI